MENAFGITREEILNLAATKLIDEAFSDDDTSDIVRETVRSMVTQRVKDTLPSLIQSALNAELSAVLTSKITPVDIWGERAGEPTTIRDQLVKKALTFWDTKVDKDGKESGWHGEPRHQHLVRQVMKEEFENAVKNNAAAVVAAFGQALQASGKALVEEHIKKLVNVKLQ